MSRPRIAIFASGSGSTAEAFIHESAAGNIDAVAELVICNNSNAGVLDRVTKLNNQYGLSIQTKVINSKFYPDETPPVAGEQTVNEQRTIIDVLKKGNYDLIALMGFMKKIGPHVVAEFGWHDDYTDPRQAMMINTHPGLLPETKGLFSIHVQEYVINNHLPFGGQTLHVVAQDYDEGPVIAEHKVAVEPGNTPQEFFDRVQDVEKKFLPGDIDEFIRQRNIFMKTEEE